MSSKKSSLLIAACAIYWITVTCAVHAQAVRVGSPKPRLTGSGSLSVAVSPGSATMALTPQGEGFAGFNVTTSWSGSTTGSLAVYAYFASTSALKTADNLAYIPTSAVYAFTTTGGVCQCYQPFTASTPVPGSSVQVMSQASQALTNGSRTDNLFILIQLGGLPQQAAGTYTGVMYLVAEEY